jgi:hypothetical protein
MEIGCKEIWPPAVYRSCWDGRSRRQIKHDDGWMDRGSKIKSTFEKFYNILKETEICISLNGHKISDYKIC